MRIHVSPIDRVGITQEVLTLLGGRNLNLDAVGMVPPNVYADAPTLSPEALEELRATLLGIRGTQAMTVVDILPGQRRHLQLDVLPAMMADLVLVVNGKDLALLANPAFNERYRRDPVGERLASLFDDETLKSALIEQGLCLPLRKVTFMGQALLLDAAPITKGPGEDERHLAGGLLTLYKPNRIGERLAVLHHNHAKGLEMLLGDSQLIHTLKTRAQHVAALNASLLIHGGTGTDKGPVTRGYHALNARHNSPSLASNCAALPENLVESGLFGYIPDAFTGIQCDGKPGLLELARQGTVFLDEVNGMSPYLQAKLLCFLSDDNFRRVSGGRKVRVDMRILGATHHNLEKMIAESSFREDLFYRLNVLSLEVLSLREHGHDTLLLARYFMQQACARVQRPVCRLTPGTYPALLSNRWPGNVRQLQNVILHAAAVCESSLVDTGDLEIAGTAVARQNGGEVSSLKEAAEDFEKALPEKLYVGYPSACQLAACLQTSHTAVAHRLRKYGIGPRA